MAADEIIFRGALTLALGLIIGFQREKKESSLAGIRTFPLFALTGFFCALLETVNIPFAVVAGLLSLAAIISMMILKRSPEESSGGLTTEISAIFIYLLGAALAVLPQVELIVVAGGICALLLHLKERMHGMVKGMNWSEVHAVMQFVLIAFVILPLLPDEAYDNFQVLNIRKIWLMVVLITGISVVSFSVRKMKSSQSGTLWTGVLGGLISSTAVTMTLSRVSALQPKTLSVAPAIIIATAVAFIRVLTEILIVSPRIFSAVILPLSAMFLIMLISSTIAYYQIKKEEVDGPPPGGQEPSQLKAAIVFAILFAGILYLSAWAKSEFGERGLYAVSLISGLIDVDAITLSTTQLISHKSISTDVGWRLILVAFLSNMVFKTAIVGFIANGRARKIVIIHFLASTLAGTLFVLFA